MDKLYLPNQVQEAHRKAVELAIDNAQYDIRSGNAEPNFIMSGNHTPEFAPRDLFYEATGHLPHDSEETEMAEQEMQLMTMLAHVYERNYRMTWSMERRVISFSR